jgi:hypothetical protein
LQQSFPAQPLIGKTVRFSAYLSTESSNGGDIEIRMRVDHSDGKIEFFDSSLGPAHFSFAERRELVALVAPDAVTISIWSRYHPSGAAWFGDPVFETIY